MDASLPSASASDVYCSGAILDAVQRLKLFDDCKTFVDMPLKVDPQEALTAFASVDKEDADAVQTFLDTYFSEVGQELVPYLPPDFDPAPSRLASIENQTLRDFGLSLHALWKTLSFTLTPDISAAPQRYSALPRKHPIVLPGGRFRETYYWDTYWIVRGLLVGDMADTARGVVENLLDDVRIHGFVPNGGRIYYLDRSQPPLLSEMVLEVYRYTKDTEWLASALPALDKEHAFWMNVSNGHVVKFPLMDGNGELVLNRYHSSSALPRPESYREDVATALLAADTLGRNVSDVYQDLRSAAESGWDFSSRWFADGESLATINTGNVVPVDLNAILHKMELNLAEMHAAVPGDASQVAKFMGAAGERRLAMVALLWNREVQSFRDYRWDLKKHTDEVSLSDFALPLWSFPTDERSAQVVASLEASNLLQKGGAATTTRQTGQQWDSPNGWPPLQLLTVDGLDRVYATSGNEAAHTMADTLASQWLESNVAAWTSTGYMYEKYNVFHPGVGGGGGEYTPQVGFGWSNGVALSLLTRETIAAKSSSAQPVV